MIIGEIFSGQPLDCRNQLQVEEARREANALSFAYKLSRYLHKVYLLKIETAE